MDHQTVGLMARETERAGIPTIVIGSARDILSQVKPPRSVFVDFPLGHQTGRPFHPGSQRAILKDALSALEAIQEPGTIIDLPYRWGAEFTMDRPEYWE